MGAVAAILVTVTIANFSDSETSTGNTVAAGTLDLQVNGHNDPNVGAVCNVGPLKEDDEVICGPIQVSNVGSLPGIADIHFVSADCLPGAEPESETPSGVCNMDHDLSVDVIYDETPDGECSCHECDCYCQKCAEEGYNYQYYCDKAEQNHCDCGGGPGEPPEEDGETVYLTPTPLDQVLSQQIDLGLLEPGETDEICISFDVSGLTNEDQGDIVTMPIEFTLHEED
jgi:predicted ribosomally synthesized peptide with SipW-like signal peptide